MALGRSIGVFDRASGQQPQRHAAWKQPGGGRGAAHMTCARLIHSHQMCLSKATKIWGRL